MLRSSQERIIDRIAIDLAGEMPLDGTDPRRHERIQAQLLFASRANLVQMDWGEALPDPEISLSLLEKLSELSPAIARLSFKLSLTVDEEWGCWALPLKAEYDQKGRSRYPTIWDPEQKKQGVLAHRYVWRTLIDPSIERLDTLDHLCRVHACCNPSHIERVTPGQNIKRGNDARHIIGGQDVLFHAE